mgnify:CR=1 FL=1
MKSDVVIKTCNPLTRNLPTELPPLIRRVVELLARLQMKPSPSASFRVMVPIVSCAMLLACCCKFGIENMSKRMRRFGETYVGKLFVMATKVPIIGFGLANVDG